MKDKLGISLSGLCICHCLLVPILAVLGLSIPASDIFESEWLHKALLLPITLIAFWSIYAAVKQHGFHKALSFILSGLLLLLAALVAPHNQEQLLTIFGALLLSYGHWLNYQHIKQCNGEKV